MRSGARFGARRSLPAALTGETSPLSQSPAQSPATQQISLRVGVGGRRARRGWSLVVTGLSEGRFGWSRKIQGREVAGAPSPGNRVGARKLLGSAHRQGLGSPFVHELQSQICGVNRMGVSEPPFVKMGKLTFGELTLLPEWQSCFLMHQSTSEKRHTASFRFQTSGSNGHIL